MIQKKSFFLHFDMKQVNRMNVEHFFTPLPSIALTPVFRSTDGAAMLLSLLSSSNKLTPSYCRNEPLGEREHMVQVTEWIGARI